MPIPKPEKKKHAPRAAGRQKKDYGSLMIRARVRRKERATVRQKKLSRLSAKHGVPSLSDEQRRQKRLATFGVRPLFSAGNINSATS